MTNPSAGPRAQAARQEVEAALGTYGLHHRAERELRGALREIDQGKSGAARRLDRCAKYLPPVAAGHIAVAVGHLQRAG
jgi:hypothetical protein